MKHRSGFSLFEMVLVLGLLAVTAALVWPALEALYGDSQLRNSADMVRARLTGARLDAMEEGVVYHFRYTPGDRFYQVSPSSGGTDDQQENVTDNAETVFLLPLGLKFYQAATEIVATGKAAVPMSGASAVRATEVLSTLNWSTPVVFRPDGTTDDAQFVVAGDDGGYVELHLRSVTGVAGTSLPQRVQ